MSVFDIVDMLLSEDLNDLRLGAALSEKLDGIERKRLRSILLGRGKLWCTEFDGSLWNLKYNEINLKLWSKSFHRYHRYPKENFRFYNEDSSS